MTTALRRKSLREITRRPMRSILTIITIAATVTGLWLFAIPLGLDDAMLRRAERDRLHDIEISPDNLFSTWDGAERPPDEFVISPSELAGIGSLHNVAAVEARTRWRTQMLRAGQLQDIWLVGVEDFADQRVNVVSLSRGEAPSPPRDDLGALLESGTPGETISIKAGDGEFYEFTVTGIGETIRWSAIARDVGPIVYVPADTIRLFTATEGFNALEVLLVDDSPEAARATLTELRTYLDQVAPGMDYRNVPEVRDPGSWEGKDQIFRMLPLLYVIAFMALASAIILMGTTMNSIVSQQTASIGVMKAIGGSRRSIAWCYLRSALIIGVVGTALGTGAGVLMSSALGRFAQEDLGGIAASWRTDPWFVVIGVAAGLGGTALAAVPALQRAMRVTVQQAIGGHGITVGQRRGLLHRAIRRATFLSSATRLGLSNTTRRRSRSLGTSIQVAMGVTTVLAFGAFSVTALAATADTLRNESSDLRVYQAASYMDEDEAQLLAARPGVAATQPIVYGAVEFGGDERVMWGLPADPIYDYELAEGRWFSAAEVAAGARIAVLGAPLAALTHTTVGDRVDIGTTTGVETIEIVGIDKTLVGDGRMIMVPLDAALAFENQPDPTMYWVETTSHEPEFVDAVAADIGSAFDAEGVAVEVLIHHEYLASAQAEDRIVVVAIQMLGLPIVFIAMIGLIGTMSTNILERTREIGILRAVGARARHVRKAFRAEGTALAVAGWMIGIPFGYLVGKAIIWFFGRALHTSFAMMFPLWLPLVALLGVLVVSRLALRPPLRRAVRIRPGEALRYE